MIWEYRSYRVAEGRLDEEIERMHRVAVAPSAPGSRTSLFDEFDIPRPYLAWSTVTGSELPRFGYLVAWPSLNKRQKSFPPFWADPRWREIKRTTDGEQPIVSRIDSWIVRPAGELKAPSALIAGASAPILEICWLKLANGQLEAARSGMHQSFTEPLEQAGGSLLGIFDLVIGPQMASCLVMAIWPSLSASHAGHEALRSRPSSELTRVLSSSMNAVIDFETYSARSGAR